MTAKRRLMIILAVVVLLVVGVIAWVMLHKKPVKAAPPPAIPVTAVKAVSQDVPLVVSAIGAAQAWTSDTILAQVSGKLLSVNFTEGADVKAGQVLAEVDPAPYRAVLMQAQGTLARDKATLAGAEVDLARYQRLLEKNSIARQTVDDEVATVAQEKGTVLLDQGVVASAQVNLNWCRIVSPVSGRAGVRLVDPGNLVSSSGSTASTPATASTTSTSSSTTASTTSGIVTINQINPIAVTFTVAEGSFEQLSQATNGFRKALSVQALSRETGDVLDTGQVQIVDNHVDASTGTVELKGRFANDARKLWPGEFVNARMTLQTLPNATVIPSSAVNRGPKGQFAFVVGSNGEAVMRPLVLGPTEGSIVVVKSGVSPGETVVTDGQMVLKVGSKVRIVQTPSPKAAAQ